MPLMETIRAYLGWCPAEGQAHRQMQPGPGMCGDTPHDGRRRIGSVSLKIDSIVKEEFWRSIGAVYWISFLTIGYLVLSGYLPISISYAFPLALIPTVAHFLIMVWYRRKENLVDPNPASILRHALGSRRLSENRTEQRRAIVEKAVDTALLVMIFLIYLYASLAYSISQIYWLPVLVINSLLLTRIVFIDAGERRITFARSVVFYLGAAMILVLRYLALRYPVVPLLQAIALVGIVAFPILYIWERQRTTEGTD
ncbi:MAG TPA: hypothetical protein PKH75_11425 [Bacillota bacterium]|nr:hypothetical protein [Bacillota bacterium]